MEEAAHGRRMAVCPAGGSAGRFCVREGRKGMKGILEKRLLFVCTGNTCRSPMAAALWRRRGGRADSAGLAVREGEPASRYAALAAAERGGDLSAHFAHGVTEADVAAADRVYGLTEGHAAALRARFPQWADRIGALPLSVSDPFGGDMEDYRCCAEVIDRALDALAGGA